MYLIKIFIMFSKTPNRTAQGILLVVLSIAFWKSQHPVVVVTTFMVLAGVVLNVFIHIHNSEIDKKVAVSATGYNGKHILVALILQALAILLIGLLTWILLFKKMGTLRELF